MTGDASGGQRFAQLVFVAAAQPQGSELWSLDQLAVNDTNNVSKNGTMQAVNLDRAIGAQQWNLRLEAGTLEAGTRLEQLVLPLFLGGQSSQGPTASLDVFLANDDGEVLTLSASGYIWGARSRSTPGGPQRPAQGLYGR